MYMSQRHALATVTSNLPASLADAMYEPPGHPGETPIQRWSSLIGIVTAICGNILISFALNIQRYAHIRIGREQEERRKRLRGISKRRGGYGTANEDGHVPGGTGMADGHQHDQDSSPDSSDTHVDDNDPESEKIATTTYLHSPYWWGGIILMTIGETGNFLAYGFAPASIVSPLGVVALISNCVIAPIMLKERFRLRDFWGVVVAIAGAVTVVLSAKTEEKKLGPHEVLGAITTMEFEIYAAVSCSLIAILVWASPRYGNRSILVDLGLVGLFGGYTALSTKGVASMASTSFVKAFTTPITYALIAVLAGTAIMQVKYLNRALQRFDSTQVIPVQFVCFTLSVIIGSAVLYRDFERTTPGRMTKFVGGCLLTFFGVFLITSGREQKDDHDDEESETDTVRDGISLHSSRRNSHSAGGLDKHSDYAPSPFHIHTDADYNFTDNNTTTQSRRSSRVSFAPPSPFTSANAPSIRLVPSHATSSTVTETSPLIHYPVDSSSALTSAAISATNTPASEHSRLALSRIGSLSAAPGYPHPESEGAPISRPQTPAHRLISSSLIPGPFVSPLSSSLSAVVADSLRRGTDIYGSRRRPNLTLRRARSHVHGADCAADAGYESTAYSRSGSPSKRGGASREGRSYRRDGGSAEEGLTSRTLEELQGTYAKGRRRAQSLGAKISGLLNLGRLPVAIPGIGGGGGGGDGAEEGEPRRGSRPEDGPLLGRGAEEV